MGVLMDLELKMHCVYTSSSRIIGQTEKNILQMFEGSIRINGRYLSANEHKKKAVYFYGPPLGKGIYVKNFLFDLTNEEDKNGLGIFHTGYSVSEDEVLFIHDLKRVDPNAVSKVEKLNTQRRSILKTVQLDFHEIGLKVIGETYINEEYYDDGIVYVESRYNNWFILQEPIIISDEKGNIDTRYKINEFKRKNNVTVGVLFVNLNKVGVAVIE